MMTLKEIARIFGLSVRNLANKSGYTPAGLYKVADKAPENGLSVRRRNEALEKLEDYSNYQLKREIEKAVAAYDRRSIAINELGQLLQVKEATEKRKCDDFLCGDPHNCPTEVCSECHYHRCEFCVHYEECEALTEVKEEEPM